MAGQSHYEINVSHRGVHFFATAERSCVTRSDMKRVYDALKAKFPAKGGYSVTVTNWKIVGLQVQEDELL